MSEVSYCTKCGKQECQHGGSRSDEALMRLALEALEQQGQLLQHVPASAKCSSYTGGCRCAEHSAIEVIAALNETIAH